MMRPYEILAAPIVVNGTLQACKENTTGTRLPNWDFTADGVTQTTDGTGCTVFDLAPGTYPVTETLKPGWTNITPLTQEAMVMSNMQHSLLFINQEPAGVVNGTIQVCKQNTTGAFLPGWDFTADGVTQTTDGTGCTVFDLAPGTYTVTETLQSGWTNVTPLAQDATVVSNTQASLLFINKEPDVIPTPEFPSTLVPLVMLSAMAVTVFTLRRRDT